MIDIAEKRLQYFDNVCLFNQNVVTLSLKDQYDLAFSYGGVWYFVFDDGEVFLVSHIPSDTDNKKGIERLSKHIKSGANY